MKRTELPAPTGRAGAPGAGVGSLGESTACLQNRSGELRPVLAPGWCVGFFPHPATPAGPPESPAPRRLPKRCLSPGALFPAILGGLSGKRPLKLGRVRHQ